MPPELEAKIKKKAAELGIDLIGFSRAKSLADTRARLEQRKLEGRATGLEWSDIAQRTNPELVLPGVRTIITAGLVYWHPDPRGQGELLGRVSRSAWGSDYHRVLGEKLELLARFLQEQSKCKAVWFVDTGPPVDRALAVESGLGWNGKNCALINPAFGSWVFLGQLYTSLELEAGQPLAENCGECERCLKACPTGALKEAYIIDPYRCISYLTQMKGFLPKEYRRFLGSRIYGCDTCQEVCPANSYRGEPKNSEFSPDPALASPDLLELIKMSNRDFKASFGSSAAGWRGRTVLQRNALVALGNLRQKQSAAAIVPSLKDERPVIRGHAAWALGEIGDISVLSDLEKALEAENDQHAAAELAEAITKLNKALKK